MTIDQLRALCMQRKGVTEDIKWEEHLCFSVAAKMFLIISVDDIPVNATFKVPEEDFDELLSQEMFSKAPHLGRYHWVQVNDINKLSTREWEKYLRQSYDLVAAKLPGKKRQELGI